MLSDHQWEHYSSPGSRSLSILNHNGVCKVQHMNDMNSSADHSDYLRIMGIMNDENIVSMNPDSDNSKVSKQVFAIKDWNGSVEYPRLIPGVGLSHPGSNGIVLSIPRERVVTDDPCDSIFSLWRERCGFKPTEEISMEPGWSLGPKKDHLRSNPNGCCKECISVGSWGLKITEEFPDEIICIRPCHLCAERMKWFWGTYRQQNSLTGVLSEPYPIPNNGAIGNFEHIYGIQEGPWEDGWYSANELSNSDMIHRIMYILWDHHTDHDPPRWKQLFDKTPVWIHKIIIDLYGVSSCVERFKELEISIPGTDVEWERSLFPFSWRYDVISLPSHNPEEYEELSEVIDTEEIYEYESDEEEDDEETKEKKQKISSVFSILDKVMDTEEQILDQGKYLELSQLLKELHQE